MAFERGEQALFESFFKIFFTQFLPLLLYTFFQKHTFVKNLHSHSNPICRQTVGDTALVLAVVGYRPPERTGPFVFEIRAQLNEI